MFSARREVLRQVDAVLVTVAHITGVEHARPTSAILIPAPIPRRAARTGRKAGKADGQGDVVLATCVMGVATALHA